MLQRRDREEEVFLGVWTLVGYGSELWNLAAAVLLTLWSDYAPPLIHMFRFVCCSIKNVGRGQHGGSQANTPPAVPAVGEGESRASSLFCLPWDSLPHIPRPPRCSQSRTMSYTQCLLLTNHLLQVLCPSNRKQTKMETRGSELLCRSEPRVSSSLDYWDT